MNDVINLARKGNTKAQTQIVNEYSEKIYNLGLHMLKNEHDAEDLLQETFIKVFESLESFEGRSSLYTWIYRIATNIALMKLRKVNRETLVDDFMDNYDVPDSHHSHTEKVVTPMITILNEELKRISFSREDVLGLQKFAKSFITILNANKIKARIGGSLAKGTLIRKDGKQDVDIFVVFDYSEDIFKLEKILNKIKLPGKLKKVHGSRDYFQIVCDSVLLEIIPVVKVDGRGIGGGVPGVLTKKMIKMFKTETTKDGVKY